MSTGIWKHRPSQSVPVPDFQSGERVFKPTRTPYLSLPGFRVCVRTTLSASLVQISFSRLCPSTSNHAEVRHRPLICHPERSRGTCCALFPLTTPTAPSIHLHQCQGGPPPLDLSSRLSRRAVEPERSAAEGPAVPLSAEANVPC